MSDSLSLSWFEASAPRYFTMMPGASFLEELASFLIEMTAPDPLSMAEVEVYLPTRRAMRALTSAIVRLSPHQASLLPQVRAIGALDDDLLALEDQEGGGFADDGALAPAISPLERRLILAQLIARKNEAFSGEARWVSAIAAATELSRLLDSFYTEEIPLSTIDKLEPEDARLAEHWQVSREFLSIVTNVWPAYLKERAMMDPAERRIALINRASERWRRNPPAHPVILAGTTGSTPAVAKLMSIAAALPKGLVMLPGVDTGLDQKAWDKIDDAHPQSGLKALLKTLDLSREQLHSASTSQSEAGRHRQQLLSLALRPAEATDDWREDIKDRDDEWFSSALSGLQLAELADEEEEANTLAILIREVLETPDKTVMLVSPDRDLTRRVSTRLKRWSIDVDDSGGVPFANSACGTFLRLVATWLDDVSHPVHLLSMIKHPHCRLTDHQSITHDELTYLDRALRGVRPAPGIEGLRQHLSSRTKWARLLPIVDALEEVLASGLPHGESPAGIEFAQSLENHLRVAQALSGGEEGPLWRGEDGVVGASLMGALRELGSMVGQGSSDYANLFNMLIQNETVRRVRNTHPRVLILGPLEARLQQADHILLGGLNEGVWPGDAQLDGFLSRPMRAQVGLPSPERRTGLSAHDFAQLATSKKVTLTYSQRKGLAPATPSRWIIRLKNILSGAGKLSQIDRSAEFSRWAKIVHRSSDHSAHIAILPPAPRPPLSYRPRVMSVTRIEDWLRDPYGIYARYILKLRALDLPDEDFDNRQIGNVIHNAFHRFCEADETPSADRLSAMVLDAVASSAMPIYEQIARGPRLEASAHWFVEWHKARLAEGKPVVLEKEGKAFLSDAGQGFTITARADRIDQLNDEARSFAVYDYKTGKPKTEKQIEKFNPQITLTGLIVEQGGFENIDAASVSRLAFIRALNRSNESTDFPNNDDVEISDIDAGKAIDAAHAALKELVIQFDDPATPYLSQPRPQFIDSFGAYDHLARRAEWAGESGESNDE